VSVSNLKSIGENYYQLQRQTMPCSHCHLPGHTYRTCPTISEEEKERIQNVRIQQRLTSAHRQRQRQQRQQRQQQQQQQQLQQLQQQAQLVPPTVPPRGTLTNVMMHNQNDYEVALYFGTTSEGGYQEGIIKHFAYVPAHQGAEIRINRSKHRIYGFPTLNVCDESNMATKVLNINATDLSTNHIYVLDINMPDMDSSITDFIIEKKEYSPPKSELDQWKEVSLKSHFLLTQIIKLGGKKNENLEPILDMVEDIRIPQHTEYDKERAGIPSTFTNVT